MIKQIATYSRKIYWNNYAIESYTKNIRSSLSQIKFAEFNNEFLDCESISKSLGSLNKLDKYITGRVSSRKVVPECLQPQQS